MDDAAALLCRVADLLPTMQGRAGALDRAAAFPAADIADLRAAGVLSAPLPPAAGGAGLGTLPDRAAAALALLRLLGRGHLALGRLIEAHINALRLVFRYGTHELQALVADEVLTGHLFGLWVTDPPAGGLRLVRQNAVAGRKAVCSGAGHVTRAVVTAADADGGTCLVHVRLEAGVTAAPLPGGTAGMRAAATGQVLFDGAPARPFGAPGDYLREPDFSAGAWRTSAVTLGGMEALLAEYRSELVGRQRDADPHQQARFGHALIAVETARLWLGDTARRGESGDPAAIFHVGLARLAVERAALELIGLAQRSLGLPAFLQSGPVERVCRDLATYLRQPAADIVLTEAAAHALREVR